MTVAGEAKDHQEEHALWRPLLASGASAATAALAGTRDTACAGPKHLFTGGVAFAVETEDHARAACLTGIIEVTD